MLKRCSREGRGTFRDLWGRVFVRWFGSNVLQAVKEM